MDLLASQIFFTASDVVDTLPINNKSNFVFGPRSYSTVIGDFGTSITLKHPGSIYDYGFYEDLIDILQDVFRLFRDMINSAKNKDLKKFLLSTADKIFLGRYEALNTLSMQDAHAYLPKSAESEVKFIGLKTYADVVQRLPYKLKYIQNL